MAAASAIAYAAPSARAVLLTPAYEAQIEGWLGLGDVTFSSIYNQAGAGMSNAGFHAAADGQGATITLLKVGALPDFGYDTPAQTIGGYNPQSWNSTGNYNYNFTDIERTAFLFNLTYDVVQRQNLIGEGLTDSGLYQTYNASHLGPAFGVGNDIVTDLAGTSALGFAENYSYGATSYDQSITRGGTDVILYLDLFRIDEIEVLTFTRVPNNPEAVNVPDVGGTFGLLGLGLVGFVRARRLMRANA